MIEFKIKNIKISFHFSFFAIISLLIILERYKYILWGLYACIIHECGHLIAMSITSVKVDKIIFYGAGIKIIPSKEKIISVKKEIFILSGGCIINFISFALFMLIGRNDWILQLFGVINLMTGIFNIIPYKSFDGGKICDILIETYCKPSRIKIMKIMMKAICLIIVGTYSIYLIATNSGNITFFITIIYFILSTIFM